jgi:CBS domain-containing protein
MRCNEIMKTVVECIGAQDSAQTAATRMRDSNVGFLPVCDDDGRVVGTITDRDIALRVVAAGQPLSTPAEAIMTKEIVACLPEDDIAKAQQLMGEEHKSRLICVDDEGKIAGVISLSDIAQYVDGSSAAKTMREVTEREARVP